MDNAKIPNKKQIQKEIATTYHKGVDYYQEVDKAINKEKDSTNNHWIFF